MIADDSSVPAKKGDIQTLKGDVQIILHNIKMLSEAIQNIKVALLAQDEMLQEQINGLATKEELREEIKASERHVLAAIGHKRYDDVGINNDRFTGHDKRIRALEVHTGLAV